MPSPSPRRILPSLDGPAEFFWTSGADGRLRFLRCRGCRYFLHPPTSYCPNCGSRDLAPDAVAGTGTLYSFTVNHQPWDGNRDPYVIGIVEIDEQPGLRLTTNIVGVEPQSISIGMPVEVVFDDHTPVFLPMFRPVQP